MSGSPPDHGRAPGCLSILVVNGDVPPRDRDAGSLRLFRMLEMLAEEGHEVTLVGRCGSDQERTVAELVALGIEVFPIDRDRLRERGATVSGPGLDFPGLLAQGRFDVALLSFFDVAEQYLPLIRAHSPLTRVVIDTVDVHHVRERRGAELTGDPAAFAAAERTRARERAIYSQADALVAVSAEDGAALAELAPAVPVVVVSNVHPAVGATPGFDDRTGLVFVGNFMHLPNADAVLDFHHRTWPLIEPELPRAALTIVGTKPPESVRGVAGARIEVTGWVPEVAPYLDGARVSIAPLRYGAGVKGKIGEALSRGLPVVTTSIGAEGLDLCHGEHALVADTPEEFAAAVVRLHSDRGLWERLSAAGREHAERRLGLDAARQALRGLLESVARTPFVMPASAAEADAAIADYAATFASADPVALVLTVPGDDPEAPGAAFARAARVLERHGLDPETVADIQICPDQNLVLPSRAVAVEGGGRPWREGACRPWYDGEQRAVPPGRSHRYVRTPRAAVLVHVPDHPEAVAPQLAALERAGLADDVDLVIAADAPGPEMESLLRRAGDARIVRGTGALGRHQAWQLAAQVTRAPLVVALAPLALPAPGFLDPLLDELRGGASLVAPVVAGAAGLRVADDGSLWPRATSSEDSLPDALPLDCLAAPRALIADGLPRLPRGEGHVEAQLGAWASQDGRLAVAAGAHVERLSAPDASVIVCTRNRAEELPDCVALLLASGARDVVIVDNDSSDDTAEVAAELAARSQGVVRVVSEPRAGLCHARNAGAAAARHELLLYVDDDARPAPGWLNHLAWGLARTGVVNAGGPISGLWPPARPAGWPGRDFEALLSLLDLGDAERTLVAPEVVYGANWAIRRSALSAVGGFDPDFGPGPDSRINGDEVSVAWRLHREALGGTLYVPGGAVGHRISPERVSDRFLLERSLCVGVERPRHAHALGQVDRDGLIVMAHEAARQLLMTTPLEGTLSVAGALERIASTPIGIARQVHAAFGLGTLAGSAALLGESQLEAGPLRLSFDADALLRGVVAAPAAAAS